MKDEIFSQFVKDRNEAFTKAVLHDDWKAVRRYCRKYRIPEPLGAPSQRILMGSIYKAVQYCEGIPESVKTMAAVKCMELGFSPFITPTEADDEKID